MSPTNFKMNSSESSTARSRKASTTQRTRPFKQRKIPKTLIGVPPEQQIYGVRLDDFMNGCGHANVQPLVGSESAPSSLHVADTTPQDTENLGSLYFPPDFVHSQTPASSQVYLGPEPSHVPVPVPYLDFNGQDFFSLTNNPYQSESYGHFSGLPSSSSTGRLSGMEHSVGPYQQWMPEDANTQSILNLSYSSTFPDNPDEFFAEIAGSSHLSMMSTNDDTGTPLPFPNFDANNFNSYYM